MYRAFRLKIDEPVDKDLIDIGKGIFEADKVAVKNQLEHYLTGTGSIDAAKVKNEWFKSVEARVFISHAHADQEKAFHLAGYLKRHFGIKAFVDSAIWEDSQKLQRTIDNVHSWIDETKRDYYSYPAVSASAAHVNMMLATSIAKMIDRCECFFFLETNASLTSEGAVKQATGSPWIYLELETARSIRIRPFEEHREMMKLAEAVNFSKKKLKVIYPVTFERMEPITDEIRRNWRDYYPRANQGVDPLDVLYRLVPSEQETQLLGP